MKKNAITDWVLRFIKGIFIGTGFILPGVSGGALAAIFGLYEQLISFLAHLTKDFKKNLLFFIPVGLGMLAGIVILAYPLGYFLEHHLGPTMWFFIGTILGTFPTLWQQAKKEGRTSKHIIIMIVAAILGFFFLYFGASLFGQVPKNTGTWGLAGIIIALGVLVPGLSPSNFLIYMDMYNDMVAAFKSLDLAILIPIGIGGLLCVLVFSKAVDKLFEKAYAGIFHFILGIIIASTLMIVPLDYNYLSWGTLICIITCAGGILLGLLMSRLETTYVPK